ncbi:MAG: rRNA maturation RNase YbeY [Deltaproteobacteria bacterium]|nr:rRNA maturation RNase YbeY [Deltaproteobacteria bacterium]MBW1948273.1 rRNA maturation RNase YbeY [Deltaproteobacteria bacterium]MBW2006770.1 rRNA maturation RNase YbeY [Deltaproteobacteria bacterium]
MEVQISFRRNPGLKSRTIRRKLEKVLSALGCHDRELSILFTDDSHMARLNERYRGKSGPTNVLAFPMGDPDDADPRMMGDVVISTDTAEREARSLGETLEETVDRLLVHGLLHLLGFDHETGATDALRMEQEEARVMKLMEED